MYLVHIFQPFSPSQFLVEMQQIDAFCTITVSEYLGCMPFEYRKPVQMVYRKDSLLLQCLLLADGADRGLAYNI